MAHNTASYRISGGTVEAAVAAWKKAGMNRRQRTRPTRTDTIARVLDGAAEAFAERGFHGASIDDICGRAGLTRGAFHSSFRSKEDLFLALYDRMVQRLRERLGEIVVRVDAAGGTMADFFAEIMRADPIDRNWFLLQAEFTLYAVRQPSVAPLLAAHRAAFLATLTDALHTILQRHGRVPRFDDSRLARLLFAIYDGNLGQHHVEPDAIRPGELMAVFGEPLLHALTRSA